MVFVAQQQIKVNVAVRLYGCLASFFMPFV